MEEPNLNQLADTEDGSSANTPQIGENGLTSTSLDQPSNPISQIRRRLDSLSRVKRITYITMGLVFIIGGVTLAYSQFANQETKAPAPIEEENDVSSLPDDKQTPDNSMTQNSTTNAESVTTISPSTSPEIEPESDIEMIAFTGMSHNGAAALGYRTITGLDPGLFWPVTFRDPGNPYQIGGQSIDLWADPNSEVWDRVFDPLLQAHPPDAYLLGVGVKDGTSTVAEVQSQIESTIKIAREKFGSNAIPIYILSHPQLEGENNGYVNRRVTAEQAINKVLQDDPSIKGVIYLPILTLEQQISETDQHPNELGQSSYGQFLDNWAKSL